MFAPTLRGNVGHRPLDDFEEGLLDPFARDVPGDGGSIRFAGDFVDLVDVHDPPLGLFDVEIRGLEQAEDDILHVLPHISGLGQAGGIGHGKGNVENTGQGLGEKGFARAGGADEEDVGFLQLQTVRLQVGPNPFVVVMDRHGQDLFGPFLSDDVLVEDGPNLRRFGDGQLPQGLLLLFHIFGDDVVAESHALIADVNRRAGDKLLGLRLALPAEGAEEGSRPILIFSIGQGNPL